MILFAYWIIRKTLNQKVLILNILTGLMWLIHGMCSFACHLVFVWCVYCGIFLDCIECAECNVSDRDECTLINDKKASDTHNPHLFSICISVFQVVCMIGILFSKYMLCLEHLVVCSHPKALLLGKCFSHTWLHQTCAFSFWLWIIS